MSEPFFPPLPWARWDDGERLGWDTAWRIWKAWLLPYRTAEWLGNDPDTLELNLGPWKWHAPDVLARIKRARAPVVSSPGQTNRETNDVADPPIGPVESALPQRENSKESEL